MRNCLKPLSMLLLAVCLMPAGCATKKQAVAETPPPLTALYQIDSFKPEAACAQALEVIENNPYEQEFFEKVFARIVQQCRQNKSQANANTIWEHFVEPLKQSGAVPPDLAITTWNYYFSKQFMSLPAAAPVGHYCSQLAGIKRNIEKEYELKKTGFEICQQGDPNAHFLNAMYVYNTMWAACNGTE